MNALFGASWKTSLTGYVESAVLVGAALVHDGGIPATAEGWVLFAVGILRGIMGRVSKDANVSNAPRPQSAATVEN